MIGGGKTLTVYTKSLNKLWCGYFTAIYSIQKVGAKVHFREGNSPD
jgi:hypothetical protein